MKKQYIIQAILALVLVFLVNIIASYWFGKIDMTEEKRFTLTEPTKKVLRNLDKNVYVRIYLKGEMPASFKRLQQATEEMMAQMASINPSAIEYEFVDPSKGTQKEINAFRRVMSKKDVLPVTVNIVRNDERTQRLLYPYAEFNVADRTSYVNLLQAQGGGIGQEKALNNSVNLLEYKLAKAFQNTSFAIKPIVMFTQGQGELSEYQIESVRNSLEKYYRTGVINLDSTYYIDDKVAVLIIAKPRKAFTEKKKFMIDQYIMNGGKVIWLVDKLNITLDSMKQEGAFYPQVINLNLEDMFFNYGFRLNEDVILDLNCSQIPLTTGMQGNKPQIKLFDWYYHPVIVPSGKTEITKSLNLINLKCPSTFDTVKTQYNVKKTPFLFSSRYSRLQRVPFAMTFEMLRYKPDPALFDKGPYPTALLLEGEFPSLYQNRVSKSMAEGLRELDMQFKPKSSPTRMLLVTDGDIIKNEVNPATKEYREAGYNKYNGILYANKQFLLNAVEYLINPNGIFKARNRDVEIRLLNVIKAQKEETYWQVLNIGLPLVVLLLFGLVYRYLRKRKYAVNKEI